MTKLKKSLAAIMAVVSTASALCVPMGASAIESNIPYDYPSTMEEFCAESNYTYSANSIGQSVDAWANALLNSPNFSQACTSNTWLVTLNFLLV